MTIYSQISSNKTKTYLIMAIFIVITTGFFLLIGKLTGSSPGGYLVMGLLFSFFSSIGSYFYSDKIVLYTVKARPATKEEFFDLYTVTENIASVAGLPMPKLYVIDDPAPNAFATGRDPKHAVVAATTGLMEQLDRTELEGVIAHELSHVKNYDTLVMSVIAVLAGTIALISDWIMRSFWWGGRDDDNKGSSALGFVLLIVVLIVSPIVATLIQLAVSRRREYLADASGALLTRYPEGLARALDKISSYPKPMRHATTSTAHLFISNPFKNRKSAMNWVAGLFSTHPPAEDRIRILRHM
jgi:heat shock protein HtpX